SIMEAAETLNPIALGTKMVSLKGARALDEGDELVCGVLGIGDEDIGFLVVNVDPHAATIAQDPDRVPVSPLDVTARHIEVVLEIGDVPQLLIGHAVRRNRDTPRRIVAEARMEVEDVVALRICRDVGIAFSGRIELEELPLRRLKELPGR